MKTKKLQKIDAKTARKNIKNEWKIESISMLIFKYLFSRILESTWHHFWGQVETQKTGCKQSVPRGLKSLPKVIPEGSEETKIWFRTSKTWSPQLQERPKIAQGAKTKVEPYKTIGKW